MSSINEREIAERICKALRMMYLKGLITPLTGYPTILTPDVPISAPIKIIFSNLYNFFKSLEVFE